MLSYGHGASVPGIPWFGDPNFGAEHVTRQSGASDRSDSPKTFKIIVIDDETLIADTVVEILKEEGFDATSVSAGSSAIELARTFQPDIVLSDVIMPGINGIEIGIKIREIVPDCRIILFSGQAATVDLLEDARRQGHTFDILAKPIKPAQLISVIRSRSGEAQ